MAGNRQEPPAPRPVRVCRICVDFLRSPAAVEPCGHVFCHACIQPQDAAAAATCPTCQGPIGSIRLLQGQDSPAAVPPRRRRRLHPFVLRWLRRKWQEAQEDAAAGGRRRRTFADGDRPPSPPVLHPHVQRVLEELHRNGLGQEGPLWPPAERGRRAGLGTTGTSFP